MEKCDIIKKMKEKRMTWNEIDPDSADNGLFVTYNTVPTWTIAQLFHLCCSMTIHIHKFVNKLTDHEGSTGECCPALPSIIWSDATMRDLEAYVQETEMC